MKILDRYIGLEFLKAFGLALLGLTVVFLAFKIIELQKIDSAEPKELLRLHYLYSIPQIAIFVTPAAMMFSVCFVVAQFTMARELVAVYSCGTSFYRAVLPIYVVATIVSVGSIVAQDQMVTPANRKAQDYLAQYKKNSRQSRDIVWQRNVRGKEGFYFIYFYDRTKKRIIGGFHYMQVNDSNRPTRLIQALSADYNEDGSWTLKLVKDIHMDEKLHVTDTKLLPELTIRFPESLEFFSNPQTNPEELSLSELVKEIEFRKQYGFSTVQYEVHFHRSLSFPFMVLIVAVVGSVAGSMGSLRSGGPLIRSLLLSTATIFFYQIAFEIGENLGKAGIVSPAIAGWGPTAIFVGVGGWLIWQRGR
ncbi:MAG: LptF/LptG family permease [Leptospiraceae bacterium]|nr:LptF/LptG family permease [Leptospiraceae bacterium]MCB1303901.1 LptF/LptG family permease [Leptospiraceae bacterium]